MYLAHALHLEMPIESKMGTFDPFEHYPDIPASSLPSDLPPEYRKQLLSILPELPGVASVDHLSNAHRDTNGNLVIDTPVLNRPWEWTENLGELVGDSGQGSREMVKNSSSLNLLAFGARMTGEAALPAAYQKDARIQESLRSFEDGFSSESLFQRDWRESRVKQSDEDLLGGGTNVSRTRADEHNPMSATSHTRNDRRGTSKGSPAVSTVSRSSGRRSPGLSAFNRLSSSTISDIIDVDALPAITGGSSSRGKRKTAVESDDEIVFVEGPIPAAAKAKKSKTAKTQVKKSTKRR